MKFLPLIINEYMGRSKSTGSEKVPSIDNISKEITVGQVNKWTKKDLLSFGLLSLKYAIMNKICATNWASTNHNSSITSSLDKLIFKIGTKSKLNLGEYVFDQTMIFCSKATYSFSMFINWNNFESTS